jgi:hypothetical protein
MYVIRLCFLDQVEEDLKDNAIIEPSAKMLVTICCEQVFRAAAKQLSRKYLPTSDFNDLRERIANIATEVASKYKFVETRESFDFSWTTPYVHFHGFDFAADERDTKKFSGGLVTFIPEVFTNLRPPENNVLEFGAVFQQLHDCRSRCHTLKEKAVLTSPAVVDHQIAALVEFTFNNILPLPSPRGTPAAIFKCPYSRAANIPLSHQRAALRFLMEIMQYYAEASMSVEFSNSTHYATRAITSSCIMAIFDAIVRIQAVPAPSQVSRLLEAYHLMIDEAGETMVKGFWMSTYGLEEKNQTQTNLSPKVTFEPRYHSPIFYSISTREDLSSHVRLE